MRITLKFEIIKFIAESPEPVGVREIAEEVVRSTASVAVYMGELKREGKLRKVGRLECSSCGCKRTAFTVTETGRAWLAHQLSAI